jgi:translocator protein
MDTTTLVRVVGASVLPNLGGLVMGFINKKAIKEWYDKLNLPKYRPPNWVFGPVWTSLYTCMGYASYLVWRDGGGFAGAARGPLALYAAHLGLNWAWSPVFFGARSVKWVRENSKISKFFL